MRYFKQLAAGLALVGLSASAVAETLVVGDQSYNARAVMEAAGVLADLPYTLEWKQFTAGSPVAEALNVGSLDIGLLGDAPPLFLGALGAPIKVIGVSQQSRQGVAILVRKGSDIHSLQDLRGKRAAIWKGSWSQQLLLTALDNAGVPRDTVQYSYLSALDASHALDGGSVDVIATWEPYVTQQERQGARVLATAEGLIPAQSFVVANNAAIKDKRAPIEDFLKRLRKARDWALSDPAHTAAYAEAWAKSSRADSEIARIWFARAQTDVAAPTAETVANAQKTVDFFAGLGLIKTYSAAGLFDTSFAGALAGSQEKHP
ncbi:MULTISPECIES: ABC transporter substrate-binding protein [unclassified Pseudomonas]|uniref:ABC transporter substrate-binding protein n=1 Tax=unclassified Pseudomonas TaxID=196821 RepID=UPI000BD5B095|nr:MULTISPECIES: ABC transporter substrate-binding protein [unclassified Pseudomonas]PVZ15353.1 NitT/TauT family transport system substrate-binding protein [Pseudomonas sp. URIL14HWK12:I12]PVZ24727.1 NitT/TauT family transport system substrate-binding protein [Pseudomonas sp. URIL14HWK12:I10]PVZ34572.1 NitT/TauT family transport system substrate-binding protein [Pseudomonas sp. URIL14HWK12:I11]SNZ08691.1 NitT/TauT family transport system substrate-binding protein [Pseudomonas sp. URIL14HWK12:I9